MSAESFGVYVHVPFCRRRCDYCAFATWTDRLHLADDYVRACVTAAHRQLDAGRPATSVYFGGGTPSLLPPDAIGAILESLPRNEGAEVTIECNPDTVDTAKLSGYRDAGVTRLSFGVQSMQAHVLAALGREHDPASVDRAVRAAGEAGFADAFSVDLIMGAAGETVDDWRKSVEGVLALEPIPRHVSAYGLTVEPGTPLAAQPDRYPDPDDQADKYLLADDLFSAAGLAWYEISNWARPGSECAHNQLYWSQGEYLGVGSAAHSHSLDRATGWSRRWWNVRTPDRYIKEVAEGRSGESAGEDIEPETRRREGLELALRTRTGVPEVVLPSWHSDESLAGLVEPAEPGRVRLTARGRLLANEVAHRLV